MSRKSSNVRNSSLEDENTLQILSLNGLTYWEKKQNYWRLCQMIYLKWFNLKLVVQDSSWSMVHIWESKHLNTTKIINSEHHHSIFKPNTRLFRKNTLLFYSNRCHMWYLFLFLYPKVQHLFEGRGHLFRCCVKTSKND